MRNPSLRRGLRPLVLGLEDRLLLSSYPTAMPDFAITTQGQSVPIEVLANDIPGHGTSLSVSTYCQGIGGDVYMSSSPGENYMVFMPRGGFVGDGSFSYTIVNDLGLTATTTVTVTVTPNSNSGQSSGGQGGSGSNSPSASNGGTASQPSSNPTPPYSGGTSTGAQNSGQTSSGQSSGTGGTSATPPSGDAKSQGSGTSGNTNPSTQPTDGPSPNNLDPNRVRHQACSWAISRKRSSICSQGDRSFSARCWARSPRGRHPPSFGAVCTAQR